jgi:hypothetical protein
MSQIRDFLLKRFPNNTVASDHFGELLSDYQRSGLAPPNMVREVISGDERGLWAHIWEAMLYGICAASALNSDMTR